jgi:hypothetical protein
MKQLTPHVIRPDPRDSTIRIEELGIDPDKHAEIKEAVLAAARAGIAEFPRWLDTIREQLCSSDPEGILASFASYGLQAHVTSSGSIEKKMLPDILQHHAELLQAILLTVPADAWGTGVLTPQVMETIFAAVPKLSETFLCQRLLSGEGIEDDPESLTIRSLQERVRLHTHGVRNWGYFSEVVRVSLALYCPLDAAMEAHYGFSATDAIEILKEIVAEYERRQGAHWSTLRKVQRGSTLSKMAKLYFRNVPGLLGTAEEMLKGLPADVNRRQFMGMIIAHSDLRLAETATFQAADVAKLANRSEELVTAFMRELSLAPGSLVNMKPEHLFLSNPVWERPAISRPDGFFIPTPQIAFSHIHRIMDRLAKCANLQEPLKKRRTRYLESELEDVFRRALPEAEVRSGVTWTTAGQQFETDLVVIADHVVIIAEAKSHRLTPEGLRGAPDRVKRHIREMVLDPSTQSARLEALILAARRGDSEAVAIVTKIGIHPATAERIIRLSVTLDDLSVLCAAEPDFKKLGWVPDDHELAPSMLITDLACIAEILDDPLLFLHYLNERVYLQKSFNLIGDELDFLGLYLATGFNLAAVSRDKLTQFSPTGMSAPIDQYYMGREAGLSVAKPSAKLSPLFRDIIKRLTSVRPPGWTLIGFHLLSCADPAEQKAVARALKKLRGTVRRARRDFGRLCTVNIQPSEGRKARVIFFLFPEEARGEVQRDMEQLAAEAMEASNLEACIVIARGTETWRRAFDAVLLASPAGEQDSGARVQPSDEAPCQPRVIT